MEADTKKKRVWSIVRWPLFALFVLYAGVVIYRVPAMWNKQKTDKAIAFIQSQKLAWVDAVGSHAPEMPDEALNNTMLLGTDVNQNGIRDDVELAIAKLHPDSARIRAAELQYALEIGLELSQVFNTDTWVAEAKYEAHGLNCLVDTALFAYSQGANKIGVARDWEREVSGLVFNTPARKQKKQSIGVFESAFADSNEEACDIDPMSLAS